MKKSILGLTAVTVLLSFGAMAQQGERSVTVDKLTITSTNTITGDVIARDKSTIDVGNTRLSNIDSGTVDINTENSANGIDARGESHVRMGEVLLDNINGGGDIDIDTVNNVGRQVIARDNSTVEMGEVRLSNIQSSGLIKVETRNTVTGNVDARGDSHIKIGNATAQ